MVMGHMASGRKWMGGHVPLQRCHMTVELEGHMTSEGMGGHTPTHIEGKGHKVTQRRMEGHI